MLQLKLVFLFISIPLTCPFAQQGSCSLFFKDAEHGDPIEAVAVQIRSTTGMLLSGVTDAEGRLTVPASLFPLQLETRHIGFETISIQLHACKGRVLHLKPALRRLQEVEVVSDANKDQALNEELWVIEQMDRKAIEQLGGDNLADILNFQMNMNVVADASTGRSTVNMFGLDGEYVKVLIDNVPVAGDNSSGNDIDISQIGLDNVERVEISEGSMGVLYGPNAVAGVVNIVTKKNQKARYTIKITLQEETIGPEYNLKDKGRHIQKLSGGYRINDRLNVGAGFSRNDFNGFLNGLGGRYSTLSLERGYQWNPKLQQHFNAFANFHVGTDLSGYYKYDRYQEAIDVYDPTVISGYDDFGREEFTARDQLYQKARSSHQLSISGDFLDQTSMIGMLSYQHQERESEEYTFDILRGVKTASDGLVKDQSSEIWFSKWIVSSKLSKSHSIDVGFEGEHQSGYDATAGGDYSDTVGIRTLSYTDFFANIYLYETAKWRLTPGARINLNSNYGTHLIWSFTSQVTFTETLKSKLVIGSAYKTPNFTQLYYNMVDANHNVVGNASLMPEDGISLLWATDKRYAIGVYEMSTTLKAYHFSIRDKIALSTIDETETNAFNHLLRTTYLNLHEYKNMGVSISNSIKAGMWHAKAAVEYLGQKQNYLASDEEGVYDEEYLFTVNAQAQLAYENTKRNLDAAFNYKYVGGGIQYVMIDGVVQKGYQSSFAFINATVSKYLLKRSLAAQLGVRNMLNVVNVSVSGVSSGVHSSEAQATQLLGNGRSYFLRLAYQLNIH